MHVAARLALVPQSALAALVDTGTGTQGLGNALVAAPDKSKASTPLVGDRCRIQAIGLVSDCARSQKLGGRKLTRRIPLDGQRLGGDNGNGTLLSDLLHGIFSDRLIIVRDVKAWGVGADVQFGGGGGSGGRLGADAGIVALGGIGRNPLLESI